MLHEDGQGHALVSLDRQLQNSDYLKFNIPHDSTSPSHYIKFHQNESTYYPNGYELSKLKLVDSAFYNYYIKETVDSEAVLPVLIKEETIINEYDDLIGRTDTSTIIDTNNGLKTAFSLSVSDINLYDIKLSRKSLQTAYDVGVSDKYIQFQLRSQSNVSENRLTINVYFNVATKNFTKNEIKQAKVSAPYPILPCMWINVSA